MMIAMKSKEIRLTVDSAVYPLEAIQAAAYAMSDRAHSRLGRKTGAEIEVCLKPKGEAGAVPLRDHFYDELLHQALRLKISEANHKIREYVVTKALSSAQAPGDPPPALPRSEAAIAPAPCQECVPQAAAAAGPPVDPELEKEIASLLAEIEKSDSPDDDPLGVAVPWEEKNRAKASGTNGVSTSPSAAPEKAP